MGSSLGGGSEIYRGRKDVPFLAHEKEPEMNKMIKKGGPVSERNSGGLAKTSRNLFLAWLTNSKSKKKETYHDVKR